MIHAIVTLETITFNNRSKTLTLKYRSYKFSLMTNKQVKYIAGTK